ncbi:MAG TPA: putative glycoside hydrolase [Candidatus Paceibacterota bacterium]
MPIRHSLYDSLFQVAATGALPSPFVVTHIATPNSLKALYMTSWVGGNEKLRNNLVRIIDETELNAIVIDIKDYTGRISFLVEDPSLKKIGSAESRIKDIKEFIGMLHDKGIYVIGRISSFQDSYLVRRHPEYAVKNKKGDVWKDFKGVSWLDAGGHQVWDYLSAIGNEAYSVGFDELNFDYIRFPSDGNMEDISYPYSNGKIRSEVIKDFFVYIDEAFRPKGIPISVDLFGMTTSNKDDLGIGQILENALAHFDYVSPMVYPSHYPPNFNSWKNPAEKPYETVFYAMSKGYARAVLASTTPMKLRPWLQDFSINGTTYTPQMIRQQIQAVYDVGLPSWMLWNASNVYTASALELAPTTTSLGDL